MTCDIVVGGQWGDEGKGKVVGYLAIRDKPDIVARAGVGPNAGHTVLYRGKRYPLRLIPSGFIYEGARLLVGAGVLVNPDVFLEEIRMVNVESRVGVDLRAGIIEKKHIEEDRASGYLREGIGTTGTGCGPANAERVYRKLKQAKDVPSLAKFLADVPLEVNNAIKKGKKVLIECSQGFGLSLYYGTYPYVTSKDTTSATAMADVGVGPKKIDNVLVVFKTYPSRVGQGPFPTEISQKKAEELGIVEYGTVTGRRRRIGTFDFELAKRVVMINGATEIALTKMDIYDKRCAKVREYRELTEKARKFVEKVEKETETPVTLISTGADVHDMVDLREEKL